MSSPPPTLEQLAAHLGGRRRTTEQFLGFSARRQTARESLTSAPTSPIAAPQAGAVPPVSESAGPSRDKGKGRMLPPFPIDDPANPLRPLTPPILQPQPNPVDDENPDADPEEIPAADDTPPAPEPEELRFLHIMESIANAMSAPAKPARTKVREPDTFDGTDVTKLRPFLVQC